MHVTNGLKHMHLPKLKFPPRSEIEKSSLGKGQQFKVSGGFSVDHRIFGVNTDFAIFLKWSLLTSCLAQSTWQWPSSLPLAYQ